MRKFIVIDNDPQEDEIQNIEGKAKREGFEVEGSWFNTDDPECLTLTDGEFLVDRNKILKRLNNLYKGESIDIVLIDFKLGDKEIDGVDLALFIKKNWRKNILILMFSGDYDLLMQKLSKEWHPEQFSGDFKSQYKAMREYFENLPRETFNKVNFAETFWQYLKTVPVNIESILLDNLRQYPDEVFKNIHPMFKNKKLVEIAKLIENNTGEGEEFKSELIERAISHFIHLNE